MFVCVCFRVTGWRAKPAIYACVCVCAVSADRLNWSEVGVGVEGNVARFEWSDPPSPNGVILLYELELTRADVAHVCYHPPFTYC